VGTKFETIVFSAAATAAVPCRTLITGSLAAVAAIAERRIADVPRREEAPAARAADSLFGRKRWHESIAPRAEAIGRPTGSTHHSFQLGPLDVKPALAAHFEWRVVGQRWRGLGHDFVNGVVDGVGEGPEAVGAFAVAALRRGGNLAAK
jgi:hypothetical protein